MARQADHREQMRTEFKEIMQHAQGLLDATTGELDDKAKKARDKLQDSLSAAKERFQGYEEKFMEKVEDTDRLIRDKPYHVIGGTFLVGLFLGWLMSRK